jgi:glycosyltransferase involved in cell wall biosynthesis
VKIVYEVTSLGYAHGVTAHMAGIYRMMCEVILSSQRAEGMEIGVCADTHPLSDYLTWQTCHDLKLLQRARWASAWHHVLPRASYARLDAVSRARPGLASLAPRAVKKLGLLTSWRNRGHEPHDIFHSLHYPLQTESSFRVRARFLAVYDLIPIKFPELCGGADDLAAAYHASVMRSARPQQDWVSVNSASTRNDYCEFTGMAPERVFISPLAAGPEFHPVTDAAGRARTREKYKLPEGPYVLSLCTLEPRKNLAHLVRCFVRFLDETRADAHLVLAGAQGWKFDALFQTIAGAGAWRERIVCPGRIADEDLAAVYSGARVFVYPTLYEGFGLPPLEAMQCGVPVISSNTSSLPEVLGDAGLMISPTDTDALCGALQRVLSNDALHADLRARGLARARLFTWERTFATLLDGYRTALAAS